uniref:Uncharacterized protein n=1 Tax=Lotharella oceanica TaxID=641309 RepID=A0A7S2TX41_9EUKA|mmetsp:Transcript_33544/g.62346  ORF Transcript_33544/g.62346 Transcript_33544/m.62346 type:complete len:215 (+) Transcript_33544:1031-1675(+)
MVLVAAVGILTTASIFVLRKFIQEAASRLEAKDINLPAYYRSQRGLEEGEDENKRASRSPFSTSHSPRGGHSSQTNAQSHETAESAPLSIRPFEQQVQPLKEKSTTSIALRSSSKETDSYSSLYGRTQKKLTLMLFLIPLLTVAALVALGNNVASSFKSEKAAYSSDADKNAENYTVSEDVDPWVAIIAVLFFQYYAYVRIDWQRASCLCYSSN